MLRPDPGVEFLQPVGDELDVGLDRILDNQALPRCRERARLDHCARRICPRISPPGFCCVCTLAYHLPAVRSAFCWSFNVAVPWIGLAAFANGTTTPALAPASAGPWKWAAVAGPDRPVYSTVYSSVFPFNVAVAFPVPLLCLAGTSWAPLICPWNLTVWADAGSANAHSS